jgi:hypothetical protein
MLSGKQNISTTQNTYQNIYFTLHTYFIQNKYVPYTINSPPPPGGGGVNHSLRTSDLYTYIIKAPNGSKTDNI